MKIIHTAVNVTAHRDIDDQMIVVTATDKVVTLPPADSSTDGHIIRVRTAAAGGSVGLTVAVDANTQVKAHGITAAKNKGLINTHGTDSVSDRPTAPTT